MKKMAALLLALAMLAGFAGGCAPAAPAATSTPAGEPAQSGAPQAQAPAEGKPAKDSVTMVLFSDITTLDPHDSTVLLNEVVRMNIYETLLEYYDGTLTPLLCESYDVSTDGLTYTFHMRKGVKFQNGEEMKASDVVFSLLRAKEAPSFASATASIDTVTAQDDYTAVVKLKEPDAPFLVCVGTKIAIMNEKATKEAGDDIKSKPIGTGPYKLTKWDSGQQVLLERFDDYHGGPTPIKNAIFTIIGDNSSAQMALETGEIDLTYNVPSIAVKELEKNPDIKVERIRTLGSGYVVYNTEKAPFNDRNFRIALNYAIDKQKVIDIALDGNAEISTGLWNKDTIGYSGNVVTYSYDVNKAKEAIAQSSYKGETLTFKVRDEQYKKIALLIQEDLSAIGVNIEVEMVENNTWIDDMKKGNYDMSYIIMTLDPDAAKWANAFHSRSIDVLNFSRFSNPEVDQLFDEGSKLMDIKQRIACYDRILQIIKDEGVVVPVYYRVMTPAYNSSLHVSRFFPIGYAAVKDMSW